MLVSAVGKVAVIGSGSVGLYYGGKLAANGVNVHFLLRSGFDEARQRGISIFSVNGENVRLDRPKISATFMKSTGATLSSSR